jgi:hypothetical protein
MFRLSALAVVVTIAFAGCGSSSSTHPSTAAVRPAAPEKSPAGDIPDNQAYVRYAVPRAGFSVKVPEGWARTTVGGAVVFTDKLNSVRLQAGRAGSVAAVAGRSSRVPRQGGTATRTVYELRAAADPVTGKRRLDTVERYVFSRAGKAAVITLSGPKGADNVDPWRIVTDSFRWR